MLTSAVPCSSDFCSSQLRCCGWESPQDWFPIPSMRSNESEGDRVPCSCYNSSATNDSTIFDKISFPQFSRLGSLARPRHNVEVCSVPANSYIYQQVGKMWSAGPEGSDRVGLRERAVLQQGQNPYKGRDLLEGRGLTKRPRRKGRIWNADTWGWGLQLGRTEAQRLETPDN